MLQERSYLDEGLSEPEKELARQHKLPSIVGGGGPAAIDGIRHESNAVKYGHLAKRAYSKRHPLWHASGSHGDPRA